MTRLSSRGERVTTASLASFVAANAIGKIDFVKFNCEGAEFPILLAAPVDLLRCIDKMLILYHLDLAKEFELSSLLDKLSTAGFRNVIKNQEGKRGWIIAER